MLFISVDFHTNVKEASNVVTHRTTDSTNCSAKVVEVNLVVNVTTSDVVVSLTFNELDLSIASDPYYL